MSVGRLPVQGTAWTAATKPTTSTSWRTLGPAFAAGLFVCHDETMMAMAMTRPDFKPVPLERFEAVVHAYRQTG